MEVVGNKEQCPQCAGLGIPQCDMGTAVPPGILGCRKLGSSLSNTPLVCLGLRIGPGVTGKPQVISAPSPCMLGMVVRSCEVLILNCICLYCIRSAS